MKFDIKKVIMGMLLLVVFLMAVKAILDERSLKQSEQRFSECFNRIPESPDSEDIIGLSSTSLSIDEEKKMQEIIKKAFEGQLLFRYYYKNEKEMDELIEDLYLSEEYQQLKKEIKEEYKYQNREDSLENISHSLEKMRFSKSRKYKGFNDRIGIIGELKLGSAHYFLFKKIDEHWKIEKEIVSAIKPCFIDENSIIKELIEQKENKTPQAETAQYFDAITKGDKSEALESWQFLNKEDWSLNPENYNLLKERRDNITEELIKKKISYFQIENIKWKNMDFDISSFISGADINNNCRSELADSAQVKVQLTDFDNNKSEYIVDVFAQEIGSKTNKRDYSLLRNWIIRDIYPQGQEPLFRDR